MQGKQLSGGVATLRGTHTNSGLIRGFVCVPGSPYRLADLIGRDHRPDRVGDGRERFIRESVRQRPFDSHIRKQARRAVQHELPTPVDRSGSRCPLPDTIDRIPRNLLVLRAGLQRIPLVSVELPVCHGGGERHPVFRRQPGEPCQECFLIESPHVFTRLSLAHRAWRRSISLHVFHPVARPHVLQGETPTVLTRRTGARNSNLSLNCRRASFIHRDEAI